ncbi:MAG: LacI family transcriptional regulator [Cellvibrionaceae bacterium]|jgi:LacI family transcriptional regulator
MTPDEKTTIHDIAHKAGVSISTVSRVLNDNKSVRESSRLAVLNAVDELDYQPNIFASSLAGGRSKTIGIITQYIASPFFDLILRGILDEMNGSDYHALFADGQWDVIRERRSLQMFIDRRVDGLIVLGGVLPEDELWMIAQRLPLIVIGRDIPGIENNCISLDNFGGAYTATKQLIQQGHRHIIHLTGILRHEDALERLAGYRQAMLDSELHVPDEFIIKGDFSEQSGVMAAEHLLSTGPTFTAIFAANDQMAMGIRLAFYRRGIRVPEDVSIIGFDDQPASAFLTPPLTTVRQPALEIGHSAASRILARIQDRPEVIQEFKARLMIRDSVSRIH